MFKIKVTSLHEQYDSKWIEDNSGDGPFLMEHAEHGYYNFYNKDMTLYASQISWEMINKYIKTKSWFIVEKP
jgi:hypothetical protein